MYWNDTYDARRIVKIAIPHIIKKVSFQLIEDMEYKIKESLFLRYISGYLANNNAK